MFREAMRIDEFLEELPIGCHSLLRIVRTFRVHPTVTKLVSLVRNVDDVVTSRAKIGVEEELPPPFR